MENKHSRLAVPIKDGVLAAISAIAKGLRCRRSIDLQATSCSLLQNLCGCR
ncbi:hypothetical protein WH47_02340 [Habropoda laboriosa]|uniref:Uncharacterized protein n=1 Tax=Habropoda laboriosa TaxID=597456 RepID=A0A0L7QZG6_9HYME|nr:hypothetical protein WH47_02340 [Habropoda laboriosa]